MFWSECSFHLVYTFCFVAYDSYFLQLCDGLRMAEGRVAGSRGFGVRGEGHTHTHSHIQILLDTIDTLSSFCPQCGHCVSNKKGSLHSTNHSHTNMLCYTLTHQSPLKPNTFFGGEIPLITLSLGLQCCQAWFHF